jgi:pentatricopeptide repeat protein
MDNRELDAQVAEFMGKPFRKPTHGSCCTCQTCGWDYDNCQCGYSEYIEKAWRVVEKMRERGLYITVVSQKDDYLVTVSEYLSQPSSYVHRFGVRADTAPLAICKAALKAVENDHE